MIFLDHMIVNRLVAWVGVVDFNQDVVEYVPSPWFLLQICWTFLHAAHLEVHQHCLLRSNQHPFLTVQLVPDFHYKGTLAPFRPALALKVSLFIIEQSHLKQLDELTECGCSCPVLSESSDWALEALLLGSEGLPSIAQQIEHHSLPKLKKRKFDVALLVSFLVLFIQVRQTHDQENARIGWHPNRSLEPG